jgi:hypothetical protein
MNCSLLSNARLFILFFVMSAFGAGHALAEDSTAAQPDKPATAEAAKTDAPAEAPMDDETKKKLEQFRAASEKSFAAIKEIGEPLKGDNAKHFYMMYSNYNLIGATKMVQSDVKNAIKACGTENPALKTELDGSFKTWNDAVDPMIKEAVANNDNMMIAQDYADAAKIRKAFKTLDETRAITSEHANKVPVTTEEACRHLLGKMSETQQNLVNLLRGTLVSFGQRNPSSGTPPKDDKTPASNSAPVDGGGAP